MSNFIICYVFKVNVSIKQQQRANKRVKIKSVRSAQVIDSGTRNQDVMALEWVGTLIVKVSQDAELASLPLACCLPRAVSEAAQPAASTGRDSPQSGSSVCRVCTAALPPLRRRVSAATDREK